MINIGDLVGFFGFLFVFWEKPTCDKTMVFMGWIRDRQRCSQIFLRWFFLHIAVADLCPWQSSPPRSSCHLPLCAAPLLLMGSSSLWELLKTPGGRGFPALNPCPEDVLGSAGSLHSWFWGSQHPSNAIPWEHLISESLLVTGVVGCDCQGTRTGKGLLAEQGELGSGSALCHTAPASGCHFVASCSNAATCLVFWISKSTPGAAWSFKASFRWFALRNSIKGTTTIKE